VIGTATRIALASQDSQRSSQHILTAICDALH
jgi:hypothetical protein